MSQVICWSCRKKDGGHIDGCAVARGIYVKEPRWSSAEEMEFASRHAVLTDDDLSWCRTELARRNGHVR